MLDEDLLGSLLPEVLGNRSGFEVLLDWLRDAGVIEADRHIRTRSVADRLVFLCWWLSQEDHFTRRQFLAIDGVTCVQPARRSWRTAKPQECAVTYAERCWSVETHFRLPLSLTAPLGKAWCRNLLTEGAFITEDGIPLSATKHGWDFAATLR